MSIQLSPTSPDEAIRTQLGGGVMEVGSQFENSSKIAVKRMAEYYTGGAITDLGCGDGAAHRHMVEHMTDKLTGVDINKEKLRRYPGQQVDNDMISYLESVDSVDNIYCHQALEHLSNPQKALELMGEKLKKGGIIYIEVPANDHIHSSHHATFGSSEDLYIEGLELLLQETTNVDGNDEHYIIMKKP